MKKILALLLIAVLSLTLLTGCSDPVADDFENYLNVEMKEINADYKKLTQEVGAWENSEDDADILASIEEILLPIVNDSLAALEDIKPETDEVKAIKEKYVKVMETYKDAFETFTDAINTQDEDTAIAAAEKLSEAVELLDEYNSDLENLAKEHNLEVEY